MRLCDSKLGCSIVCTSFSKISETYRSETVISTYVFVKLQQCGHRSVLTETGFISCGSQLLD